MPYINTEILKAFVSDTGYLVKDTVDGLDEAIAQADEIIYQKTGISAPTDPATSNAFLRNIACALVVWFTSGMQGKLEEQEIDRRKKMYDDAIGALDAIQSGRTPLRDNSGTVVSSGPEKYFATTQRLTSPL